MRTTVLLLLPLVGSSKQEHSCNHDVDVAGGSAEVARLPGF
jgi:hypothetical protein